MSKRTYKSNEGGKSIALFTVGGVVAGWIIGRMGGCSQPAPALAPAPTYDREKSIPLTLWSKDQLVNVPLGASVGISAPTPDGATFYPGPMTTDTTVLTPVGYGTFVATKRGKVAVWGSWGDPLKGFTGFVSINVV